MNVAAPVLVRVARSCVEMLYCASTCCGKRPASNNKCTFVGKVQCSCCSVIGADLEEEVEV